MRATCEVVGSRLGIGRETLRGWVNQSRVDAGEVDGMTSAEREEVRLLKAELRRLREDNAILKAAAEADLRIAFARRSSRFSLSSCTSLSCGSAAVADDPGTGPGARNQFRKVDPGMPNCSPTWLQARLTGIPGFSLIVSCTVRTARSRNSSLYFLGAGMTPLSCRGQDPPPNPGWFRMSTGLLIAVLASAAALATLFLRTAVDEPLRVAAGTMMFAVIYVGIGAAVGSVVTDQVNGTVVILLVWILDVFFGPALTSPDRVQITRWMPTHFVTLWMVDLPLGHGGNLGDLAIALVWVGGALLSSGLLLTRATRNARHPDGSHRPGWAGQVGKSFRMGMRQYRRNPALWVLLVTVPVIFIWLSKLITEERYSVMRVIDGGQEVDMRFWLPDTHAGTMAPIAVASLAAVAGLFIALNNRDGDRRLVQAGMRRSALLVGRIKEVAAAVLVAAAASLTITAMVFTARQWAGFIAGTLLIGAVYALLGMCLGFLLGRVTGVLIAFVIPFLDLGITQSPMLRLEPPGAAAFLPGYGPYRVLIDTGLTDTFDETGGLLIAAVWILGLTSVVVVMFSTRTSTTQPVPIGKHARPDPGLA